MSHSLVDENKCKKCGVVIPKSQILCRYCEGIQDKHDKYKEEQEELEYEGGKLKIGRKYV